MSLPGISRRSTQLSVSASSVPTAITTSASVSTCCTGCASSAEGRLCGCEAGMTPLPAVVVTPMAPDFSRKARTAGAQSTVPPPTRSSGCIDPSISFVAASRSAGFAFGRGACMRFGWPTSAGAESTSSGNSSTTGRGRWDSKTAKASETAFAISWSDITVRVKAVKGAMASCWLLISCSRPRPLPRSGLALTLQSTRTGTESE